MPNDERKANVTPRIVVLASGGGTNCQALIDACEDGRLNAEIAAVVTNNEDARVIRRAEAANIDWHYIEHRGRDVETRRSADERLIELIQGLQPDLVVLAGWMRILGAQVGAAFPIINLHPARPGEFAGTRAIERAYESWQADEIDASGVMAHWVPDAGVDIGPVIYSETVAFATGDSLEDFAERMHTCEHRVIVQACELALRSLLLPAE